MSQARHDKCGSHGAASVGNKRASCTLDSKLYGVICGLSAGNVLYSTSAAGNPCPNQGFSKA